MKKILLAFICLLQLSSLFAVSAKYESEEYSISVNYNDTITPGDAIFVRMTVSSPKNHKKSKNDFAH